MAEPIIALFPQKRPDRLIFFYFLKIVIAHTVYTECTRINYIIVPVTNFNKYLHYGTSGNE